MSGEDKTSITVMDETSLKILDILSRQLGNPMSINELRRRIEQSYGSAHYASVYNKLHLLTKEQITNQETTGKASVPTLNFKNWFTNDLLTQTDMWKKQQVLRKHPELKMLLSNLYSSFTDLNFIKSMSIIDAECNLKLNRAEFLILLNIPKAFERDKNTGILASITTIHKRLQTLQKIHNLRIDCLILTSDEFMTLLKSKEANPLREMLPKRINFMYPEAFWTEIMIASEKRGLQIKFEEEETNPSEILEDDLVYNLQRFGYQEIGTTLTQGKDICIEYIVTSILLSGAARRIEAIPVILSKNEVNYSALIFLCGKYGCSDKLLGLLKALERNKSSEPLKDAILVLESLGTKESPADESTIREKLILYSVV